MVYEKTFENVSELSLISPLLDPKKKQHLYFILGNPRAAQSLLSPFNFPIILYYFSFVRALLFPI